MLNPLLEAGPAGLGRARRGARGVEGTLPLGRSSPSLPIAVADYVDFYSSLHHAANVGRMFRPGRRPAAAQLAPPAGRLPRALGHRRRLRHAGAPPARPAPRPDGPRFGPTERLDFELELGAVIGIPSSTGPPAPVERRSTTSSVWCCSTTGARATSRRGSTSRSARSWRKSFATSIGAWISPLAACAPPRARRTAGAAAARLPARGPVGVRPRLSRWSSRNRHQRAPAGATCTGAWRSRSRT